MPRMIGDPHGILSGRSRGPRWLYPALTAALTGAFLVQAVLSMGGMSATFDEPVYITAGYSYWKTRDGRMNFEHPVLMKLLVAIPLLPLSLKVPTDDPSWWAGDEGTFPAVFLHRNARALAGILFPSRLLIAFVGVLLAVFVRNWAAELWGAEAGLAALLLCVFEPNILAHSRLATLDLGLVAFTFISMFYVWKWFRTGRTSCAILASVGLGLSLLSKHTALAFLPIFLAQFALDHVVASRSGAPRHIHPVKGFLQLLAGGAVVVVALYALAFQWHPLIGREHHIASKVLASVPGLGNTVGTQIIALGQRSWVPALDSYYVAGALADRESLAQGSSSFLMGHHSRYGWWYYYPVAFLIKTPVPILLLVMFRLFRLASVPMVAGEYVLVLPIIGVMILACLNTIDIGLRYILPLYPFLFVWLSRIVALEVFRTDRLTAALPSTSPRRS